MFPENNGGAAVAPIEIGTHGTVGYLVMKEIEYFKRLDQSDHGGIHHQSSSDGDVGGGASFWRGFEFLKITWRGKKRKGDKFLPRVCTKMDVIESCHHHRANKIPGFNYHNL